jgi:SAM-dependent methyltransferase
MTRDPAEFERLERLRQPDRYPRASRYDPAWVLSLDMGPHPLWQLEDLLPDLALEPGMRVLDLGAGKGATSVFLAKECDVDVVALDLWVPAEQAGRSHQAAGVADRVTAVTGDVREMPFADEEFDAIVSVDAFEYFGTDVHLLPSLMRVLRPGGRIAISTPALRDDPYQVGVPAHVEAVVGWEAAAWRPPAWWARHWELSGLVEDVRARWQVGGRDDWLLWARAHGDTSGPEGLDPVITMLESDVDEEIGFTLASARKRAHGTAR